MKRIVLGAAASVALAAAAGACGSGDDGQEESSEDVSVDKPELEAQYGCYRVGACEICCFYAQCCYTPTNGCGNECWDTSS